MAQAEGVADFMRRLLEEPFAEERRIGRQTIMLVGEPGGGDNGAVAVELPFAENKG